MFSSHDCSSTAATTFRCIETVPFNKSVVNQKCCKNAIAWNVRFAVGVILPDRHQALSQTLQARESPPADARARTPSSPNAVLKSIPIGMPKIKQIPRWCRRDVLGAYDFHRAVNVKAKFSGMKMVVASALLALMQKLTCWIQQIHNHAAPRHSYCLAGD